MPIKFIDLVSCYHYYYHLGVRLSGRAECLRFILCYLNQKNDWFYLADLLFVALTGWANSE